MAPVPASPLKLPSYHPPAIMRIRTPSPLPPPGTVNNALVAALGCETIVRDIIPMQGHTSLAQLQAVINQVAMESPNFIVFPVKAESSGSKELLSSHCYVRLSEEVQRMDAQPRPNLLWMWAEKIKEMRSDWDVAWSPQPWKDKKLWVRIAEVGEVTKDDKDKLHAVEKECQARGYTVLSVFPMRDFITVILTLQSHTQALIDNGITIPSISPHPLPAYPFRQLEPQWAFELVITGISCYDQKIIHALDQYFHHTFVDAEKNTLLQVTQYSWLHPRGPVQSDRLACGFG